LDAFNQKKPRDNPGPASPGHGYGRADMSTKVEPCEHLQSMLRAVSDGLASCPRCKLYAKKTAGSIRASKTPFPSNLPGTLHLRVPLRSES
jgi:hypothetical protein